MQVSLVKTLPQTNKRMEVIFKKMDGIYNHYDKQLKTNIKYFTLYCNLDFKICIQYENRMDNF